MDIASSWASGFGCVVNRNCRARRLGSGDARCNRSTGKPESHRTQETRAPRDLEGDALLEMRPVRPMQWLLSSETLVVEWGSVVEVTLSLYKV